MLLLVLMPFHDNINMLHMDSFCHRNSHIINNFMCVIYQTSKKIRMRKIMKNINEKSKTHTNTHTKRCVCVCVGGGGGGGGGVT